MYQLSPNPQVSTFENRACSPSEAADIPTDLAENTSKREESAENQLSDNNGNELVIKTKVDSGPHKDDSIGKAALHCLKTCLVKDADRGYIVEKLNISRQVRTDIMKNNDSDIRENFPFFISNPELVIECTHSFICYNNIRHKR